MVELPKRSRLPQTGVAKPKERDSKKLEFLLHVAEMKASQGKRVSASQIDAVTRLLRRAFNINSPVKDTLVKTARQEGWNIILCQGEADVHIGGLHLDESATVISGDSDLLFYPSVHNVLRPMETGSFHSYKESNILALLKLTALPWTCVGIVSGNDYDNNIIGFGITTNHKLISEIQGNKIEDIVSKYLKVDGVVENNEYRFTFSTARVFGSQLQHLTGVPTSDQPNRDQSPQNQAILKARLLKVKHISKKYRKTIRAAKG
ncbi:hypothetical protein Unana1_02305 [Umbelopsis nana]